MSASVLLSTCQLHWYVGIEWVICVVKQVADCYFFSLLCLLGVSSWCAVEGFLNCFYKGNSRLCLFKIQTFDLLLLLVEKCFWKHIVCLQLCSCEFDFPSKIGAWMSVISVLFWDLMQYLFSFILFIYFFKGMTYSFQVQKTKDMCVPA